MQPTSNVGRMLKAGRSYQDFLFVRAGRKRCCLLKFLRRDLSQFFGRYRLAKRSPHACASALLRTGHAVRRMAMHNLTSQKRTRFVGSRTQFRFFLSLERRVEMHLLTRPAVSVREGVRNATAAAFDH